MKKGRFSQQEIDYIKEKYSNARTDAIAKVLDCNIKRVYRKATALGLKKSIDFLRSSDCCRLTKGSQIGKKTQFKKGHISHNKGKKQEEYMSIESIEKTKSTRFNKGNVPKNTKFDGYISYRLDKRAGRKYKYIRVSKGNMQPLHRVIWEEKFGEIPKNMNLIFIDGNTENVVLENLKLIDNAQNMKNNSFHENYPEPIQKAIMTKAALTRQINKMEDNEKQN